MTSLLLIDIGNSRVKWGRARRSRIEAGEPFARLGCQTAFADHWENMPPPAQALVANVAGSDIADALEDWMERHWHLKPRFIRSEAKGFGVTNGYANPEKLGVDRWVALVGARHACLGAVCVADCGTAITFDALDEEGKHLGGLIAPGLGLMRESLARGTHGLDLANTRPRDRLARDTSAAIASGTRQAAAGLIERAFRTTVQSVGSQPSLLLTGGDAPHIAAALEIPCELRPDLVLEGLWVMAA